MIEPMAPLVRVESLTVDYLEGGARVPVVNNVSFSIAPGETVGLAGESGCGKSTTAYALLGYRRPGMRFRSGAVYFEGRNLLALPERTLRRLRGSRISIVPQNPATALNPSMPIGRQIVEALEIHAVCATRRDAEDRSLTLLAEVGLPRPRTIAAQFPYQLSGGGQQRVAIAMALACRPSLVVLDEPTTGLDVTTQARILELLNRLQAQEGMAIFYVSHNMAVLAQLCHRLAVMYAGQLIEVAPIADLLAAPAHPYSRGLIAAVFRTAGITQIEPGLRGIRGMLRRSELPEGCPFAPRCDYAEAQCFADRQTLAAVGTAHQVACRRWRWVRDQSGREPEARPMAAARSGWALSLEGGVSAAGPYGLPDVRPAPSDPPAPRRPRDRGEAEPKPANYVLDVRRLSCAYPLPGSLLQFSHREARQVVYDVSFSVGHGETFALVGETGSGKSTIARAIAGLLEPSAGEVLFRGRALPGAARQRSMDLRREIQLIFQNPDSSLNPRQRITNVIGRPLEFFFGISGTEQGRRVEQILETVQLDRTYARRYPAELSGGERQRIAIARALTSEPRLLLCDEILSALDVSVQANILDLLRTLQAERELAYLFISHDLAVVRSVAQRVGVLYRGQLCEMGNVGEVFAPPFHPYTEMLLQSILQPVPGHGARPAGRAATEIDAAIDESRSACPFAHRCPRRIGPICDEEVPPWHAASVTHSIRCHIPNAELARLQRDTAQVPSEG